MRKWGMMTWFIVLAAIGAVMTVGLLFATHGEAFPKIFFKDSLDTGMDFFHSIEYVRGREPYALYNTLYPPLANAFFFFLICFVPGWQYESWISTFDESVGARGTAIDLRVWQPTMMLFIVFILITAALTLLLVQRHFEKNDYKVNLFSFFVLFSYGVLSAYERGNIVVIAMLCSMFFVRYRNSENRLLSELALISLAVAAGIKLYPALLGMVLLYDRQYKKALRTVLYGLIMFICPAFVFKEGLGGIRIFLDVLGQYSETKMSVKGFSFSNIGCTIVSLLSNTFGLEVNESAVTSALTMGNYVSAAFILLCGFFQEKNWQKALACCVAMFLYRDQGTYGTVFMLIPLVAMVAEEKKLSRGNAVYFFALVFFVILLPIMEYQEWSYSPTNIRYQLCMLILMYGIIATAVKKVIYIARQGERDIRCRK